MVIWYHTKEMIIFQQPKTKQKQEPEDKYVLEAMREAKCGSSTLNYVQKETEYEELGR